MTELAAGHGWNDRRRYWWPISLVVPSLVLIAYGLVEVSGSAWFWWTGAVVIYGVVPLLDWWVGSDASNPPHAAIDGLEGDRYYRGLLLATYPLQMLGLLVGVWVATTAELNPLQWLGLAITVGIVSGGGINAAHEWGHKRGGFASLMSKLSLAPAAYGHFHVEHNRGHHKNVATPEDPASARLGETFWQFLPRTLIGSVRSAWRIERTRLLAQGRAVISPRNDILQAWFMTAILYAALVLVFGWAALPFLIVQAFYGAALLEAVNYIEHYGLLRRKDSNGRYVRCEPEHSWNANQVVSNLMLYQLQRHSDHHANPRRSYQTLRHFDDSPQLPVGYAALIPVVHFPRIWFGLMNHRVLDHYDGDVRRANMQPD
ncbi:alkane 1-monooxygenase [Dokdonella sp.]|uniref:alkane 1-monooxygenase n=1 Tax=Dokdonella sp. TaxID=2291710 RepID=UPI003C379621